MAGVDDGEVITRGKIFISYRRGDDPGFALFVHERLEQEFGRANLFMDVEGHIKPGDDFVKVLNDWVAQCDVLLAIIGEGWIEARDEDGNRRLEKESRFCPYRNRFSAQTRQARHSGSGQQGRDAARG